MIEDSLKRAATAIDDALARLEDEAVASVALLSARAFIDVALLRLVEAPSDATWPTGLRAIPRRESP